MSTKTETPIADDTPEVESPPKPVTKKPEAAPVVVPAFEKSISDWGAYGTGLDIHSDGIDNDNDGFLDAEDDDEYGSPRESAIEFALRKLSERIITEVTSTW